MMNKETLFCYWIFFTNLTTFYCMLILGCSPNRQNNDSIDDDPTEYYDTVIYSMDTEDFGEDYAVGEVFEVDRETIDGSVMSTGPVNISP